ncbi:hypothetical protein GCM10017788_08150 [Amycolatopsis acidiphila]|nr:hypothetical protein GCM10017788_08150 [Amycolatopsis acidiphila]
MAAAAGPVDILVDNAGSYDHVSWTDATPEIWLRAYAARHNLAVSLAHEVAGTGVTSNVVAPGAILVDSVESSSPSWRRPVARAAPKRSPPRWPTWRAPSPTT